MITLYGLTPLRYSIQRNANISVKARVKLYYELAERGGQLLCESQELVAMMERMEGAQSPQHLE